MTYNNLVTRFIMAHNTALKLVSKSFSNGENYHVGMKQLEGEITSIPGFIHKLETSVDPRTGYTKTRFRIVPIEDS
jgi:hypothetical protein